MGFWSDLRNGASYWSNKVQDTVTDWANIASAGGHNRLDLITKNLTGETAQENIEIERQREDSRYQRLMEDLAAAGLNPSSVLGSSGGAVPSNGVSGSVQSNLGALGGIISAGADAYLTRARHDNIEQDTQKKSAETFKTKLESGILEETGLAQALATLAVTGQTAEEKFQNANKLALEADLYAQKKLTENEKTILTEYEAKLAKGEYDEKMATGTLSGIMIPFSESQAIGAGIDVSILKNKVGLNGNGSQSTSVSVPIGLIYAAYDKKSPQHDFAIDYITGAFLEDFGSQKKHFTKNK